MADDHDEEPTQNVPTVDGEPLKVPVPSRKDFLSVVEKVAGGGFRKQPAEKDQPPERAE
jgi:hypothetical protein